MELVLELQNNKQFVPAMAWRKTFRQAGGVIGREESCDWVIPDRKRQLSKQHATISYRDGVFFLTDTSSNGVQERKSGVMLRKGVATPIEQDNLYVLGDFEIRAQLVRDPATFDRSIGCLRATSSTIPDDAFLNLELDPLLALDAQERTYSEFDELISPGPSFATNCQRADYARIDTECLIVPELVSASDEARPEAAQSQTESFWEQFGTALGIKLEGRDQGAREALALNVAHLLKQSIDGLQQSLRTRSELKNELRLPMTTAQVANRDPLKRAVDADEVLGLLLQPSKPGQLTAQQSILRAHRDLQAHQVALLTATRAAVRGVLEHFSPEQLTLRLERDNPPLFATSSNRWRAYGRYHQSLRQDDDWIERLLARDFAQAYEEQVRLISTLHTDH